MSCDFCMKSLSGVPNKLPVTEISPTARPVFGSLITTSKPDDFFPEIAPHNPPPPQVLFKLMQCGSFCSMATPQCSRITASLIGTTVLGTVEGNWQIHVPSASCPRSPGICGK